MNAHTFVKNWKKEKEKIYNLYTNNTNHDIEVVSKILKMNLDSNQKNIFNDILNGVLDDVFYTFLLGLDGSANIGDNMQETFKIYDEKNNLISENGEIESEAYEQFIEK